MNQDSDKHVPVMATETITALDPRQGDVFIDCTFGRGGHCRRLLADLGTSGRMLALDRDPDAVAVARRFAVADPRLVADQARFSDLRAVVDRHHGFAVVDGILLDLGVSSPQLCNPQRGFSFTRDGPLDMRMDCGSGLPLATWLATADITEIRRVIYLYGEERQAGRIARAIVAARTSEPIVSTVRLARIISQAAGRRRDFKAIHPATRSFQAFRIFINSELDELRAVLPISLELLRLGGRIAVISFHSLEDRIVKRFFRSEARGDHLPRKLPVPQCLIHPRLRLVGKGIRAEADEIERNPRARSAMLRVAERCA